MKPIKVVDFYCLAHTIYACQPPTLHDCRRYWEAAINKPIEGQECAPVFVIDRKPYWRVDVFPAYKGNRKPYTDPLLMQTFEVGFEMGIPALAEDGLEADDWAGILCMYQRIANPRVPMYLNTTDTDWTQLVDDEYEIVWVNYGKHTPYIRRASEVSEWAWKRHNILITEPVEIIELKSQLGDSSDNIPKNLEVDIISLRGKSWIDSLSEHGYDLENLIERAGKVYDSITR